MQARQILASAGALGILCGAMLAGLTPAALKPMAPPEWRKIAATQRDQQAAFYPVSLPEDLSPRIGFGNPAVHGSFARMPTEVALIEPARLPAPALREPQEVPVAETGNEAVVAELDSLNARFAAPPPEPDAPAPEPPGGATPAISDPSAPPR
jgi:hypothetical protein